MPDDLSGILSENVNWIGDALAEGVAGIGGRFHLYAGLFLLDFKHRDEIKRGIELATQDGAAGIFLFGRLNEAILEILGSVR